jgi:hypothetical protein
VFYVSVLPDIPHGQEPRFILRHSVMYVVLVAFLL